MGSTQFLKEMSTRNLPEGKGRPARNAENLTVICVQIVYKMWEPRSITTYGPSWSVAGITLPFTAVLKIIVAEENHCGIRESRETHTHNVKKK
jgi:hypothetical protein